MASGSVGEESFLSHVERTRREIQARFQKAHKTLQDRETDLLAEIQRLRGEYSGDRITQQIQELSISREAVRNALKENENKLIFEQSVAPIDARIAELETKLQTAKDSYRSVSLEWDIELDTKLSVAGEIRLNGVRERIRDYTKIGERVIVFGNKTSSIPGVFAVHLGEPSIR